MNWDADGSPQAVGRADPRRWRALAVLGLIQFMIVLDVTVVNVALPSIQRDLGLSHSGLAWVVDGYVLMAGGLLLLGGRLADIFGRRRLFLLGVALFGLASAVCGAAVNPPMLVSSRFVQGVGEALASPASLGLIALLFPDTRERAKALGIWGGISGLAGVSGVVISGALTDLASWRWIFYINVPIALLGLLLVPGLVSESRMERGEGRLDPSGALVATGGLVAIVYGTLRVASSPWASWAVLLPVVGGVGLLVAMILIELNTKNPLIPLRFFKDRTRVAANLSGLLFASGFFSYIFLMTLFLQQVLGYSPLRGGLAYLPFGLSLGVGVGMASGLLPRLGLKPLLAVGFFGAAIGLFLAGDISTHSPYLSGVLPGMVVLGSFSGVVSVAGVNAALHGATSDDSSLASGVQSAMQQVGGALGLAGLATLALRNAALQAAHGVQPALAATAGYTLSFRVAAATVAAGGLIVLGLLPHPEPTSD
jgi:EmrB/QacA subfamily drug resistance transporter